ncbi:MAG: peptide chain release factor N(5)-glutamine methyltransferase [Actinobacteria bacterium]|nr:MAG: peptide chain release factor N(5)-glutamine methyltransferase [Actinomycetota bacterium]
MADRVWTVIEALDWTRVHLAKHGDPAPRRAAEWLLSAATGLSRVQLYAHHDRPLTPEERATFRDSIERRVAGEPLQHITGEVGFRHLVLRVGPGVFIPRPETEVLVDVVLRHLGVHGGEALVADLCAGSGAVALSIAHECEGARVWAVEADPAAAALAAENADRLGLADAVTVLTGDLFAPLPADLRGRLDAVVANPPYIPTADLADLPAEVRDREPRAALDGGADGLDTARRIMDGAREWLTPGGVLAMELDESRVADADKLMRAWYEGVVSEQDLAQRPRVVAGHAPAKRADPHIRGGRQP